MNPPIPANETERLTALHTLGILDSESDPSFDMVTELAAFALRAPIAAFSLVDSSRQWFKSSKGLSVCETPREHAFCAHAILQDVPFIIDDALQDDRFAQNPLVTGAPHIRAYLGAPITLEGNIRIGTICVIDTVPRCFTADDALALARFAQLIKSRLELLRTQTLMGETSTRLRAANVAAARAQVVLEQMSEGLVLQHRGGAITQANPAACRVLGLSLDQLLGRASVDPRWRSVREDGTPFPGDQHPAMQTLATGQGVIDQVFGIHTPEGELRWLRVSTVPLFEDDQPGPSHVISTFSDITGSKLQEARLRQLSETAHAASLAKTAFLANMSHEIRTPLNGVVGIAGALARTPLLPRQSSMVEVIQTSGRTLERLLGDILDMSKIEAGQVEMEEAPFCLKEEVEAAVDLLRIRADEKGLKFQAHYGEDLPIHCFGDAVRLRQIISNLLSNAIKFTPSGEVSITLIQLPSGETQIQVSDTGIGFDDSDADWLFDRFTQADGSITRRFGGTGLGLAITHGLVQLFKGTILVKSAVGEGSSFTVTLPLKVLPAPRESLALAHPPVPVFDLSERQILLVEDNELNQKVFEIMLEPMGLQATVIDNGTDAIAAYEMAHFDIIFMDMQMPIMNGVEATQAIRALERACGRPPTPIVMLTANATEQHRLEALQAGADLHVTKPVTIDKLNDAIAHCLSKSPAHAASKRGQQTEHLRTAG